MEKNRYRVISTSMIKEIARSFGRTKNSTKLAEELGLTSKAVCYIVQNLRKHGVNVPKRRDYWSIKQAVKELKIENPELFKTKNKYGKK